MGGVLGVGNGSDRRPRFVRLAYEPTGARNAVAFVGKGVVFDSGGLSLKTASGMETMKTDMSGAAAVIAAMSTLRDLGVKTRVYGYVPLVENMPSGHAIRPGDVLKIRNGKTVEVLNTDAEGRLILADALAMAADEKPQAIIDLATLTGACMVALGDKVAGLMGNHDAWIDTVREAAGRAGESVWHLPLPEEYRKMIDSEIADLRNTGTAPYGGAFDRGTVPARVRGRRAVDAPRHRGARARVGRRRLRHEGRHRLRRPHPHRARPHVRAPDESEHSDAALTTYVTLSVRQCLEISGNFDRSSHCVATVRKTGGFDEVRSESRPRDVNSPTDQGEFLWVVTDGKRGARLRVALACGLLSFALVTGTSPSIAGAASINQNNGCTSVTPGVSLFVVPITGIATPASVTVPDPITLSGVTVSIQVSNTLIASGIAVGVLSAAPDLANIGVSKVNNPADGGTTPDVNGGVANVTAAPASVKLKITGSNTAEGMQIAANTAPTAVSFFVTANASDGGNVKVYTSVTNPTGGLDPTRTGTELVGNLVVPITLDGHMNTAVTPNVLVAGSTVWTPLGGDVTFTELNAAPANLATPSPVDKAAAPLTLATKINALLSVGFQCWPGTATTTDPTSLIPAAPNAITTVTVTGGVEPTTTTTSLTTPTTQPAPTTTTLPPPVQGKASYNTDCTNTINKDVSHLLFTITATGPTQATAGQPLTVSKQNWTVEVPGSLLTTGMNLDLIHVGQTVSGTVKVVLTGSNTAQGTQTSPDIPVSIGPITTNPATGEANSITAGFPVPDMTFTPAAGTTKFSMGRVVFLIALSDTLKVTFTCDPTAPIAAVLTTTVTGNAVVVVATTTPTTAATVSPAAAAGSELPVTGTSRALMLFAIAILMIDLGALALTASRSMRRSVYARGRGH